MSGCGMWVILWYSWQVGVPPCQQELRGWKGAAPFPVTGESQLLLKDWHCDISLNIRSSVAVRDEFAERELLVPAHTRAANCCSRHWRVRKDFWKTPLCICISIFKTSISVFSPSDPSSPADTNYKLTIIDEHEGGKVKIGQFLQWDLILFLSRCITWPFPGVTQWTKLRETLPLWQASLYSDRCNT